MLLNYLNDNAHPVVQTKRKAEMNENEKKCIRKEWLYIPENVVQHLLDIYERKAEY